MTEPPSKEAVAVMGLYSLSKNTRTILDTGARESSSTSGGTTSEGCVEDLVSSSFSNNSTGTSSRTTGTNGLAENHDHPEKNQGATTSADISVPSSADVTGTIKGYVKIHAHDILSGRGNGANQHSGNIYFRNLISNFKRKYVLSEPAIKKQITNQVLNIVQGRDPPGRFLRQEVKSGEWIQLDRETALRKTAQALREKAPELKKRVLAEAEKKDEQHMIKKIKRDHTSTSSDSNQSIKRTHQRQDFQQDFQASSSPPVPSSPTSARRAQNALNLVEPDLRLQEEQVLKEALALERIQAQQQQNNAMLQAAAARDATNEFQHRNQQYQVHIDRLAMMSNTAEHSNTLQQSNANVAVILNDAHFMGKTASLDSRQAEFFKEQARHSIQQRSYDTSGKSQTYALKYDSVVITVTPTATSPDSKQTIKNYDAGKTGKEHYETLKNISIVASTSSALTALYVIVRMSSDALAFASFDKDLSPICFTEHDVLVDSTDIINHPGNLYLAELIQTHRPDYSSVRFSDEESRLKIADHVITCITKKGSNLSKVDPKRGRFLLSTNDAVVQDSARAGRCAPRKWEILSESVIRTMVTGLFDQACAFILAPETNDVLFGKFDKSMISPGNMFYKMIVAKCRPLYVQSTPDRQYQYAAEIVGFITSRPGRFLGYCEDVGMWMPLPFELAIEKTQEMLDNDASDFIALSREPLPLSPTAAQMGNTTISSQPPNDMVRFSNHSPFHVRQTNPGFEGGGSFPPAMSQIARDQGTLTGANELLALNSIAQHRFDNEDRRRNA